MTFISVFRIKFSYLCIASNNRFHIIFTIMSCVFCFVFVHLSSSFDHIHAFNRNIQNHHIHWIICLFGWFNANDSSCSFHQLTSEHRRYYIEISIASFILFFESTTPTTTETTEYTQKVSKTIRRFRLIGVKNEMKSKVVWDKSLTKQPHANDKWLI